MTTPTNYSLQHRKETILTIAEKVFAQNTFAGAGIRLISKKLGVNSAMIGYYFGSKKGLYLDIFKLRLQEIAEEISRFEEVDLNPSEKLKAYLAAYIGWVSANQDFHRLLSNELATAQHPSIIAQVSEARNHIYNFLLKTVGNGIAAGHFKKIVEEVFVLNVLALVRSVFTDYLTLHIHLSKPPQEDFTQRIVSYIMSMLAPGDNKFERRNHV